MHKLTFLLASALILSGCSATNQAEPPIQSAPQLSTLNKMNHGLFTRVDIPDEEAIFTLPVEENTRFQRYFDKYKALGMREDRIIASYLEDHLTRFKYDGKTLTASESLLGQEGNCISLAILTEAYARAANIDTTFKEVSSIPVYEVQNGAVLVANHFKIKLIAPFLDKEDTDGWNSYNRAGTIIDYFPVYDSVFIGNASKNDLMAKFYANRSVDNMLAAEFDLSYSYLVKALVFAPNDPELLNLAALLHKRTGDVATAKRLFHDGYAKQLDSYNLLSNYLAILDSEKDKTLITAIESRIEDVAITPIDWLLLAKDALRKGELSQAEILLVKVIDRVPYLPEPYIELAKINYQRGYTRRTRMLLETAKEKTKDKEKLAIVEAKQAALQRLYIDSK